LRIEFKYCKKDTFLMPEGTWSKVSVLNIFIDASTKSAKVNLSGGHPFASTNNPPTPLPSKLYDVRNDVDSSFVAMVAVLNSAIGGLVNVTFKGPPSDMVIDGVGR
jgi:hypothetical protein